MDAPLPPVITTRSEGTKERKAPKFIFHRKKISSILSHLHCYSTSDADFHDVSPRGSLPLKHGLGLVPVSHSVCSSELRVACKIYASHSLQQRFSQTYLTFITINSSLFSFAEITATLAVTILYEKIKSFRYYPVSLHRIFSQLSYQ